MYRLRTIDYALLIVCALLSMGTIYDNAVCRLIDEEDPARAMECTGTQCESYPMPQTCLNEKGERVQYQSRRWVPLKYYTCVGMNHSQCEVLEDRIPCVKEEFYIDNICSGTVVCFSYGAMMNKCRYQE